MSNIFNSKDDAPESTEFESAVFDGETPVLETSKETYHDPHVTQEIRALTKEMRDFDFSPAKELDLGDEITPQVQAKPYGIDPSSRNKVTGPAIFAGALLICLPLAFFGYKAYQTNSQTIVVENSATAPAAANTTNDDDDFSPTENQARVAPTTTSSSSYAAPVEEIIEEDISTTQTANSGFNTVEEEIFIADSEPVAAAKPKRTKKYVNPLSKTLFPKPEQSAANASSLDSDQLEAQRLYLEGYRIRNTNKKNALAYFEQAAALVDPYSVLGEKINQHITDTKQFINHASPNNTVSQRDLTDAEHAANSIGGDVGFANIQSTTTDSYAEVNNANVQLPNEGSVEALPIATTYPLEDDAPSEATGTTVADHSVYVPYDGYLPYSAVIANDLNAEESNSDESVDLDASSVTSFTPQDEAFLNEAFGGEEIIQDSIFIETAQPVSNIQTNELNTIMEDSAL